MVIATGTLVMFRWELDSSDSRVRAQTVALTTMVVYQVLQAGNARSESESVFCRSPFSNRFLFAATAAAAAVTVHVLALHLPPTQYVLRVEPIELAVWLRIVVVACSILVAMEAHKAFRRRRSGSRLAGR